MIKFGAVTLLGLGLAFGSAALSHHRYVPTQSVDMTENGHLPTTENAESQYGGHGKNVPHVQQ
jgi:hypothetical protein|tara:strand:+ start:855 stop:1043 length:189 start_codon:yes stop_codon:yes gene_type:complete